jgi:hypothetical protein
MSDKSNKLKQTYLNDVLKEDYAMLVDDTALLLLVLADRVPGQTIESLTTQFALNVRYIAGLHGSKTRH